MTAPVVLVHGWGGSFATTWQRSGFTALLEEGVRRGEFRVSVSKDYLVFASAHFITFAGHRCEGLHGHNYRARVTIEGALDEESWFVYDFVQLKRLMRGLRCAARLCVRGF